jgi:hypothetical protein
MCLGIDDLRGPVICNQLQGEKATGNCQFVILFFWDGMIPLLMISFSNTGVKAIPLISNIPQIWPCAILLRWDELLHNLGPNGPVSVFPRFESIVGCSFPKIYRCSSSYINTDLHFFSTSITPTRVERWQLVPAHRIYLTTTPTNDILSPAHHYEQQTQRKLWQTQRHLEYHHPRECYWKCPHFLLSAFRIARATLSSPRLRT